MSRIDLTDTFQTAAIKLAEGNPGAISVLCTMAKSDAEIDPLAAFGPLTTLLNLDTCEIYGSRIWTLFKDVCGQEPVYFNAVFRAHQLGIISRGELFDDRNFPILIHKIRDKIGTYAPAWVAPEKAGAAV